MPLGNEEREVDLAEIERTFKYLVRVQKTWKTKGGVLDRYNQNGEWIVDLPSLGFC